MPLGEAGGNHSNDCLPRHGGRAVSLQYHLPVVAAEREDCRGSHTHPRGVLSDADRAAIAGDVCFGVAEVAVP